jgi:hypothetical protein
MRSSASTSPSALNPTGHSVHNPTCSRALAVPIIILIITVIPALNSRIAIEMSRRRDLSVIIVPIWPPKLPDKVTPRHLSICQQIFMRIMIEKQILDNINMYKDIKNMGIHGTTRPDKVHLSITICLNTMLKQGEKDNLRDERGVFTESPVLINSLIIPQPSALFYVMNHSSITKNPVHQIMGPSVRRDALNAQLDMVRDYGSIPN